MKERMERSSSRATSLNPFGDVSEARLGSWVLLAAIVAAALGTVVIAALEAGPGFDELTELVLAGDPAGAEEAMRGWSVDDRAWVAFVAGFDFTFGIAWTSMLAMACFWGARRSHSPRWQLVGVSLGWLAWVALALDLPENGAYLAMVVGNTDSPWPQMALAAVVPRCAILAAGIAYLGAVVVKTSRSAAH